MNKNEFIEILHNDDFYKYLSELRETFKKELDSDFKCGTVGTNKNIYNHSCYTLTTAIYDNYLYYLEKKYNVGRGKHE